MLRNALRSIPKNIFISFVKHLYLKINQMQQKTYQNKNIKTIRQAI